MNNSELTKLYRDCTLCPRKCHVNRYERAGFCGAGTSPVLARAALHMWEEPCLGGSPDDEKQPGSGTIFFSNCTLKCIFCQNYDISSEGFGREVSVERLSDIMLELEAKGAANIDLVTATHYVPSVIAALDRIKHKLSIPVVFNCGGYENVDTIRMLDGYVDIYLPDLKYFSDELAVKYSAAPGYFETALLAIKEMIRQVGKPVFTKDSGKQNDSSTPEARADAGEDESAGLLKRGVILRHMVLPGCRKDSIEMLDKLTEAFSEDNTGLDSFLISLMSQYTPFYKASEYPEINRRLTSFEYDSVVRHALDLGFNGFMQEKSSAKEEYTPSFNLEGV